MKEFLVEKKSFDANRVDGIIERLKKSKQSKP